jgi:WD repeat-containing protein 68
MLQIQTQNPPVTAPAKSANINPSHGYSRSSPAGAFDSQRYVPYPGTPDAAKFNSPSSQKYTPTQSQQAGISNSPLGLADIRPSGPMGDGPTGANPYLYEDEQSIPTNSNYVAPWATYALDWCKWSVHPHSGGGAGHGPGAGKIALGSYLEDGHNYVGDPLHRSHLIPSPKFHVMNLLYPSCLFMISLHLCSAGII